MDLNMSGLGILGTAAPYDEFYAARHQTCRSFVMDYMVFASTVI